MANDLGQQLSIAQQLKDTLTSIPDILNKIGGSAGEQTSAMQQLKDSMSDSMDTGPVDDINQALEKLSDRADEATSKAGRMGKALKRAGKGALAGKAAFSAFSGTLRGTFSVVGGLFKSLMNLGSFIVGGLMQSWGALVSAAYNLGGGGDSVRAAFEKVRGEFGSLAKNEGKAVGDAFRGLRKSSGFAATSGQRLYRVFGSMAKQLEATMELAKEFGDSFSVLKDEFVKNTSELFIMNRGLGLSGEALTNLSLKARAAGQSMKEALEETTVLVIGMEEQIGVDGKKIGKNLDKLSKNMSDFGHMSKKELVATAGYAAKLGVGIEGLEAVFNKFENFEDAATGAAKLAEAFGMNVDAMAMMNAESPAEQMDMMRQAFLETGKTIDDLSRSERKYFEELTGLKGQDLYNAFDPSNANVSFDDMLDAAEAAEEQMDPAEAMLKAAEKMEKAIGSMTKSTTGFFDMFKQGMQKGFIRALRQSGALKGLKQSLRNVFHIGEKLMMTLFGEPNGFFAKKNSGAIKAFNKVLKDVEYYFESLASSIQSLVKGDINPAEFLEEMKDHIFAFLSNESVDKFGKILLDFFANGIKYMLRGFASMMSGLSGAIDGGFADSMQGLELGPHMKEGLLSVQEAFTNEETRTMLADGFKGLLTSMANAIIEWAEDPENRDLLKKVTAIMFGPAVIRGLFAGVASLIVTTGGPALASAFAAAFKAGGAAAVGTLGATIIGWGVVIIASLQSLWQSVSRIFDIWGDDTRSWSDKIMSTLTEVIMFPSRVLMNLFNWIYTFFGGQDLMPWFNEQVDNISFAFTALADAIMDIMYGLGDIIAWPFEKLWDGWEWVKSKFRWFSPPGVVVDFANDMLSAMNPLGGLSDIIGGAFGSAWDAAKSAWDGAGEWASGVADKIVAGWEGVKSIGASALETGKTWLSNMGSALGISSPAKEVAKLAGHSVNGWNSQIGGLTSVGDVVSSALGTENFTGMAASISSDFTAGITTGLEALPALVSEQMPNLEQHLELAKVKIADAVKIVANTIGTVKTSLSEMGPINAEAMVSKVAAGLSGEGTVQVQHEGVNIKVNMKVIIDSKDLASALANQEVTKKGPGESYFKLPDSSEAPT